MLILLNQSAKLRHAPSRERSSIGRPKYNITAKQRPSGFFVNDPVKLRRSSEKLREVGLLRSQTGVGFVISPKVEDCHTFFVVNIMMIVNTACVSRKRNKQLGYISQVSHHGDSIGMFLSRGGGGGGGGVLPYMGYIGMCRCEGYGFQAVYSSIGYINQSVWV